MSYQRILFDIETNNLLEQMLDFTKRPLQLNKDARLWCASFINLDNINEMITIRLDELTKEKFTEIFKNCTEVAGHNIVNFDLPVLKLFDLIDYKIGYISEPSFINGREVIVSDTLVWSQLLKPDRFGGHSLGNLSKNNFIAKSSHSDFSQYSKEMEEYMELDVKSNWYVYHDLMKEKGDWDYTKAYQQELKLVDLTLKQSLFGFKFNTELAQENLNLFDAKLNEALSKVNPLLPAKPLNKGEQKEYTPPVNQIKKDLTFSSYLIKFAERVGATLNEEDLTLTFQDKVYKLPYHEPIVESLPATIDDLDHLKGYLLELGWVPTEWKVRDLTKDSKKLNLTPDKIEPTVKRYVESTLNGPYKNYRLHLLETTETKLEKLLLNKAINEKRCIVPVSPMLRIGTEKTLCKNLEDLGEIASFVKDVTDYLTYKHRRNSIAGGTEDEDGTPTTGYLSLVREDGRVSTPAFTIGANTFRYRHIGICNIPRVTSLEGARMRGMFGCGEGYVQLGADFASLENRIQGSYVYDYNGGPQLAETLIAEKPNDLHCLDIKTEILTKKGWMLFKDLDKEIQVAQWNINTQHMSYTYPLDIISSHYKGDMVSVEGDRLSMLMTPNHRCVVYKDNKYQEILAENLTTDGVIPTHGLLNGNDIYKQYVAKGLIDLFTEFQSNNPNIYCRVIRKNTGVIIQSEDKEIVEKIQIGLLHCRSNVLILEKQLKIKSFTEKTTIYQLIIPFENPSFVGNYLKHTTITTVPYDDKVYCVTVRDSYIVCRRNGKVFITGNSINAKKLGISRNDAKSVTYGLLYGAQANKVAKMLNIPTHEAEELVEKFWDSVAPLKALKHDIEKEWESTGKQFIKGLDGRKLFSRAKHSLIESN